MPGTGREGLDEKGLKKKIHMISMSYSHHGKLQNNSILVLQSNYLADTGRLKTEPCDKVV